MTQTFFDLNGLSVSLTAHEDEHGPMLMVEVTCAHMNRERTRFPLTLGLAIDRSGSMAGTPLDITLKAVEEFALSLDTTDRVAMLAYDDDIEWINALAPFSAAVTRRLRAVQARGSTNLYRGWLDMARAVREGGRVILLSDGQANQGRFQDGVMLAQQAERSYREFLVTTSTIGIGEGYDESVMGGMARCGGGSHYFAHQVQAVISALAAERSAMESLVYEQVTLHGEGVTLSIGNLHLGETKCRVIEPFTLLDPSNPTLTLSLRERDAGMLIELPLSVPTAYGVNAVAARERWLQRAAELELAMSTVTHPESATAMRDRLSVVVDQLRLHPADDATDALIQRLEASIARLELLIEHWSDETANHHRKRSTQTSQVLYQRAHGFTSFQDEHEMMRRINRGAYRGIAQDEVPDAGALALVPLAQWIAWEAMPLQVGPDGWLISALDAKNGLRNREMEQALGTRVRVLPSGLDRDEFLRRLGGS